MGSQSDKNTSSFDPLSFLQVDRLQEKTSTPSVPSAQDPAQPAHQQAPQPQTQKWTPPIADVASSVELQLASPQFQEFESFLDQLVLDQLDRPEDLLKLNRTRRESLGRFLAELARLPEPQDPESALKSFVRLDRTASEHEALKQLFKQIAIVQLGKALLLKAWSCHQNFPLVKADLKDLTSAVERGLRPFIHLQTTTCQLVTGNFYSWYKLDASRIDQLWILLEKVSQLQPCLDWLLDRAIQLSAETLGERDRYSSGFYQNLWLASQKHQIFEPRGRQVFGFSPTLRDGTLWVHSPESVKWIGFESLTFELLFCEIRFLWTKPQEPPLWMKGSGLEMSMEHQATLLVTHNGKQNSLQQMESVTSCEVAWIAEENLIRTQSRTLAGQALRKQIDQHSILKKLKHPSTTRGMYQACQALEKLRQGGLLMWAREELLDESSGKPALQFILNQAKIALIADFSALQCECGKSQRNLPKALYLLKKESQLEGRKSHRPLLVKAFGTLRNEEDVALLFDRVFSLVKKPEQSFPLEPFQLHSRVSPMDQREWEQHWFNPNDDQMVDRIEALKRHSTPLGQLAHIRHAHLAPLTSTTTHLEPTLFPKDNEDSTSFYLWIENSKSGSEVKTCHPKKLPSYVQNSSQLYSIIPFSSEHAVPLQVLLRSQLTRDWLNYSVERKKGNWVIKESDLKTIPVPEHIDQQLRNPIDPNRLPQQIQTLLSELPAHPGQTLKHLEQIQDDLLLTTRDHQPLSISQVRGEAFALASKVLFHLEDHQSMLYSLVGPDEQIDFPKLFKSVMAESETAPIDQHPLIRASHHFLTHQGIAHIQPVKMPSLGVLLSTRHGVTQHLQIPDAWLRERTLEWMHQIQSQVQEPSWNEMVETIRLPKDPARGQQLALQVLKAFGDEKMKRKELTHLINVCLSLPHARQSRVGLLQ